MTVSADEAGRASASRKLAVSVALTLMASTGGPLSAATVCEDGNFSYDVASVPLIAEVLKLLISILLCMKETDTTVNFRRSVARPLRDENACCQNACYSDTGSLPSTCFDDSGNNVSASPRRQQLGNGCTLDSNDEASRQAFHRKVTWRSSLVYIPPSLLFLVINNLRIWNMRYIDPASAELLGTLRIALTAIMLRCFLRRSFSRTQWASLALLSLAVAPSQMEGFETKNVRNPKGLLGVAVVASCSASASVYMEWALKENASTSMHIQNAHIYGWGVLLNAAMYLLSATSMPDGTATRSLIDGYTPLTWLLVVHLASSGLIVSWLLKYSDSIAKIQATSASLFLTVIISAAWLGTRVSANLMLGIFMSSASLFMYHGLLKPPFWNTKGREIENNRLQSESTRLFPKATPSA